MANASRNTIVVKWPAETGPKREEGLAGEAGIIPGMLVEVEAVTGDIVKSTAIATGPIQGRLVAVENPFIQPAAGVAQIDAPNPDGETMPYVNALPGAELYMWLAAGETTAIGSEMRSNADGTLVVGTPAGTDIDPATVGIALEVVASGGSVARILVRSL